MAGKIVAKAVVEVDNSISDSDDSVTKKVAWPPKEEFDNPKVNDGMGEIISSAAKKYVRNVESTQSEQHGQYTLSRELFQPGKFKSDEIWKPNDQQQNYPNETIKKTQTPRRTFKSLDDVIQNNQYGGPVKQPSYHVPPGTTRTRKAQEAYSKHLEIVTK